MNKHLNYIDYIDTDPIPEITLKIGTDFSGIEAPIMALNILSSLSKLKIEQLFCCEIDDSCIKSIKCNYNEDSKTIYRDITTRDHEKLPNIDGYIAGFPCVSFSTLGKREGFDDPTGRGKYFFDCLDTIKSTKPKFFILENVKGLVTHNKGDTFNFIINKVNEMKDYNIYYKVLNTSDYGIRQNRARVFIIGINKSYQSQPFKFPEPIGNITNIQDYLEDDPKLLVLTTHKKNLLQELIDNGKIDNVNENWFVNLNVSSTQRCGARLDMCPCLLAGGGSNCAYYLTSIKRNLTQREYLRFQGFPDEFKQCVSNSKLYKQVGNSMSVNVLCFLFVEIFRAMS